MIIINIINNDAAFLTTVSKFIDTSSLGRRFHTKHGLHLNHLGNTLIASMISKAVHDYFTRCEGKYLVIPLGFRPNCSLNTSDLPVELSDDCQVVQNSFANPSDLKYSEKGIKVHLSCFF